MYELKPQHFQLREPERRPKKSDLGSSDESRQVTKGGKKNVTLQVTAKWVLLEISRVTGSTPD